MANNDNLIWKVTVVVWLIGLLSSNYYCEYFSAIKWPANHVPAINSYAKAAHPENLCAVYAMWVYAWISTPLYCYWLVILTYMKPLELRRDERKKVVGTLVIIGLVVGSFVLIYFGMFDPYDLGKAEGIWEKLFKSESRSGVVIFTASIWYAFYALGTVLVTELFSVKRS